MATASGGMDSAADGLWEAHYHNDVMATSTLGFWLVWRIWWLTDVSLLAIILTVIARSFVRDTDYMVKAGVVQETERRLRRNAPGGSREGETRGGIDMFRPHESNP